jgi:two-component system alkaline phosphatase synthesis response regulator PhoP
LAATDRNHETILIADDSPRLRTLLGYFFKSTPGYQVHEATDGQEVIEKVPEIKPDLIVLDLAMPRLSGLQAAKKLRQMAVSTPIILFTLYARELSPTEISDIGISAVVLKPDLTELHKQVEFLLKK